MEEIIGDILVTNFNSNMHYLRNKRLNQMLEGFIQKELLKDTGVLLIHLEDEEEICLNDSLGLWNHEL